MKPAALSLHRPLEGARARIVAFPHAGGGATAFRNIRSELEAYGIELCPLQPPGRENRAAAPLPQDMNALAEEFAAAVAGLPPLPTAFLGHSLGGRIAYLTARRLASRSAAPRLLIASASLAPTVPRRSASLAEAPDFRARIIAMGGIPEAVQANADLMNIFEAVIRADIRMSERHIHAPGPALACPIVAYCGKADSGVPLNLADAWGGLTASSFRRRDFEGGHFFLYADPALAAACLAEDVEQVLTADSPPGTSHNLKHAG